jgi:hypothetical protein
MVVGISYPPRHASDLHVCVLNSGTGQVYQVGTPDVSLFKISALLYTVADHWSLSHCS